VLPVAAIAIGRPLDFPAPRTRSNDARIHHETW